MYALTKKREAERKSTTPSTFVPHRNNHIRQNPAWSAAPALQAKLTVNQPGDLYEQEADRVADQVMRMPAPQVQRRCACGGVAGPDGECAACKARRLGLRGPMLEEEKPLQTKRKTSSGGAITAPSAVHNTLSRSGQPLDTGTRAFMEPRFGRDFGGVRVHTGSQAAQSAQAVNARAYTVGNNVVFGAGEYAPGSDAGRKLLAHELTHVVQQGASSAPLSVQRLGANPGCTDAQTAQVHQAIFNARGWLNKAIRKMETTPTPSIVTSSLRRNFGPTYGVVANIPLIVGRLRRAYRELTTIPIGCAGAADAMCAAGHCGHAGAGSHAATMCTNVVFTGDWVFDAGCVLHEALHAAFTNFIVDEYSGWHGHSSSHATYPGTGTDPLLNADSYTTLAMDLSG